MKVMIPRPPTCIRIRRTDCPNPLKDVPVSTTVSPVTQTAEVAVKIALVHVSCRSMVQPRLCRKTVPTKIARLKKITGRESGGNIFLILGKIKKAWDAVSDQMGGHLILGLLTGGGR